ncbi:MAG: glycogen debranching N-terminal domain-containing protein, partial [Myxococcaceae bacterium]
EGEGPTLYPVACSPQSWASGSVLMLLGACLGLSVDAKRNRVAFDRPVLPEFIRELRLRDLRVGAGRVSLTCRRYPANVGINVDSRVGPLEVVISK